MAVWVGNDADAVVRYASWYTNGHTYRLHTPPLDADVFEVEVRECDDDPGPWIQVDSVGPFEIESMCGWYENYFWIHDAFREPFPDQIQVRFKASDHYPYDAVEAAIDWFEVTFWEQ